MYPQYKAGKDQLALIFMTNYHQSNLILLRYNFSSFFLKYNEAFMVMQIKLAVVAVDPRF